jgi:hypothetical protein
MRETDSVALQQPMNATDIETNRSYIEFREFCWLKRLRNSGGGKLE